MDNQYQQSRWKQRFQNFERSYSLLQESVLIEKPSIVERAGMIQFFEITFELGWKVLKDYLEAGGFSVKSPRDAIKLAFEYQIIEEGQIWLEALGDRNLTVHTYEESKAQEIESSIRSDYFPMLCALKLTLESRLNES